MATSSIHNGWHYDPANTRLDFYYRGTRAGDIDASGVAVTGTLGVTGASTLTGAVAGAADFTLTGAGVDYIALAGSARLGSPAVFATTQGQGVVHMGGSSLSGVAPVGATATSGGIFASDTAVMKIIAAGTANSVRT